MATATSVQERNSVVNRVESVPDSEPAISTLVSRLLQDFPPGRSAVLLLCDPEPTDVTPAVAAMAVALASQVPGQLLVVDGTFRNTGLARLLAARPDAIEEPRPGWADVLTGKATLQQAVRGTRLPNLEMLPGRTEETAPTAPPLPEPNDRWTASLDQLRLQYQFVLIGTSPVDNPATMAIARAADAIYLLVRPGYTGQRAIRQTLRALHRCGARVLGCLLVEHSAGGC